MRWIVLAVGLLATAPALADHGVPAPARGGLGWLSWLLVGGAVIAVGLAAWAFFAPDRPEGGTSPSRRNGPEPPAR
ncbi:MAG TPA: hypothetical protein VIB60_02885 [Methylomirabilota bacterium]|jgi:hypothetical protein